MSLKELRMKRGLMQLHLADKIDVTRQHVAASENDARKTGSISLDVAIRICDALYVRNPRKLLDSETFAD